MRAYRRGTNRYAYNTATNQCADKFFFVLLMFSFCTACFTVRIPKIGILENNFVGEIASEKKRKTKILGNISFVEAGRIRSLTYLRISSSFAIEVLDNSNTRLQPNARIYNRYDIAE